jgi:hypothetical protein
MPCPFSVGLPPPFFFPFPFPFAFLSLEEVDAEAEDEEEDEEDEEEKEEKEEDTPLPAPSDPPAWADARIAPCRWHLFTLSVDSLRTRRALEAGHPLSTSASASTCEVIGYTERSNWSNTSGYFPPNGTRVPVGSYH